MREKELKSIKEGLGDLAAQAEMDHEIQMARSELYKIAKYAIKLHEMLKGRSEAQGLEAWQQSKITKAADYMGSVYHNLEYEMKFGEQMAEGKQRTGKSQDSKVKEVAGAQKCWPGHRKAGTQAGTGKNAGKRVNKCVKIGEDDVEESGLQYHTGVKKHGKEYMTKAAAAGRDGASQKELGALKDKYSKAYKEDSVEEAAKKGLYYNVNKRKKAGTSRPASSSKAPTAQAWKDAAKTAKKESVTDTYKLGLAQQLDEKAKSKAQQKFMGMVHAAKKDGKPSSPEVAKAAKGMSKTAAKDYASTKHKGKPEHVKKD